MSEHKPLADRLKDEVDAFFRLWREHRWLAVIFLVVLVGFCLFTLIGWLQRGKTIEELNIENRELKRDIRQLQSENQGLRETVAPLIKQAAKEFPGEQISESLKKIVARLESQDPLGKPIASASATANVLIESDEKVNTHYMDAGGYLVFGRGSEAMLVTSSRDSFARQTGDGEVAYHAVFEMSATHSAVGKPIEFLGDAQYLQISFRMIPKNSRVIKGDAVVVINGSETFHFQIPPQQMQNEKILVRGIGGFTTSTKGKSTQPSAAPAKQ